MLPVSLQNLVPPPLAFPMRQLAARTRFDGRCYVVNVSNASGATAYAQALVDADILIEIADDSTSKTYEWNLEHEERYTSVCMTPVVVRDGNA